jgi:hypothetical protein
MTFSYLKRNCKDCHGFLKVTWLVFLYEDCIIMPKHYEVEFLRLCTFFGLIKKS